MFSTPKKKPTAPPELGRAWFTLAQMHAAFGVTPQGFASSVRPLLTPEDVKNAGERGAVRIRCRAAIDAWAKLPSQDDREWLAEGRRMERRRQDEAEARRQLRDLRDRLNAMPLDG
jgi:hypothetical protein